MTTKTINLAQHQILLLARLLINQWDHLETLKKDNPDINIDLVTISQSLQNIDLCRINKIMLGSDDKYIDQKWTTKELTTKDYALNQLDRIVEDLFK